MLAAASCCGDSVPSPGTAKAEHRIILEGKSVRGCGSCRPGLRFTFQQDGDTEHTTKAQIMGCNDSMFTGYDGLAKVQT